MFLLCFTAAFYRIDVIYQKSSLSLKINMDYNNYISNFFLQKPSIYYLQVKSDIRFRFATTLVTSKVANPANTSQEVKFDVTLPDEAYISDFKM